MGKKRIGGLVVLQRKDDLALVIANRVEWDALLSREMLLSIFWGQNPVHDGAAILVGDRVRAVRGILPLTRRLDLPGYLGTRHRAAIGITETTDACAIVVSEETGRVSGAVGGVLQDLPHQEAFFEWLDRVFPQGDAQQNSILPARRLQSLAVAMACVILVVAAWFAVTRGQVVVASRDIPVEVHHAVEGQEIVSMQPHTVTLRLRGSELLMSRMTPRDLRVVVDMQDMDIGLSRISLGPDQILLPPGIMLEQISPDAITLDVDIIREARIPVQVDWVGRLPEGVRVTEIALHPKYLAVRGRSALLDSVPTLYTEPVDIGDGILQQKTMLSVVFPEGLFPLEEEPDWIRVRVKVEETVVDSDLSEPPVAAAETETDAETPLSGNPLPSMPEPVPHLEPEIGE